MGELPYDDFLEYVKENSRTKPYPTKGDIAEEFNVSDETVRNKAKKGSRDDLIIKKSPGNVRAYLHVDNDNNMESEVERLVEKSSGILSNRSPTLEEIAKLGNFDEQDKQFREIYYNVLQSKGIREPEEGIIEEKNEQTVSKIIDSVLIRKQIIRYEDPDEEKRKRNRAKQYLKDYIDEHVDVSYSNRDTEGIPQRVYIDFDEELEILLGQSDVLRRNLLGKEE